jgi:transglutaminase-like putative cysteine protease
MRLHIKHTTTYQYDQPVVYALQKTRLRPQNVPAQTVEDWQIDVTGGLIETHYLDHYGNYVDLINVDRDAQEVAITAWGTVETHNTTGIFGRIYGRAPLWHFKQMTAATTAGTRIRALAAGLADESDQLDGLHRLSERILDAAP